MAVANKSGKYACSYCGKEFSHSQQADHCRDSHELVYLQISKEDLNRLNMFLRLKQDELLTNSLMDCISRAIMGARRPKYETNKKLTDLEF